MNKIELAARELRMLTPAEDTTTIRDQIEQIEQRLLEANAANPDAMVSRISLEKVTVDLEEIRASDPDAYYDRVEIVTPATAELSDGRELTEDDADELAEGLRDEIEDLEAMDEDSKKEDLEAKKELLDEIENLEFVEPELYWNYCWRWERRSISTYAADKANLIVVRVDGTEYVTLGGCGMDLSPCLVAYKALAYGGIGMDDRFDRFAYMAGLVGIDTIREMMDSLRLPEAARRTIEAEIEPITA